MTDTERLLTLNIIEDVGSVRTHKLLEHFGSIEKVFAAQEKELMEVEDIGPVIAPKIVQGIKEIDIDREVELVKKHNVKIITFLDKDYPKNLKNIYDPPIVLYVKGEILPEDDISVAIVGSRIASFYGLKTAEKIGYELAMRGITVVSGLARGIDSSAHKGALKAKRRTIAVLGSGILNIYPEEHTKLADEISLSGAVVSEFPMRTIPDRSNFPKRNRIISGLSLGVVVVEAGERSGALITSDAAIEQGREVFAVPGKVDSLSSKGTHKLIKQGAKLLETTDDIIEELNLSPMIETKKKGTETSDRLNLKLDKKEMLIYNLLSNERQHIDELSKESGMTVSEISKVLLNLEIKKLIRQLPGKSFVRR